MTEYTINIGLSKLGGGIIGTLVGMQIAGWILSEPPHEIMIYTGVIFTILFSVTIRITPTN